MAKPIGGDEVVRVDHDREEADEGEAEKEHGGEAGDSSLHQGAAGG